MASTRADVHRRSFVEALFRSKRRSLKRAALREWRGAAASGAALRRRLAGAFTRLVRRRLRAFFRGWARAVLTDSLRAALARWVEHGRSDGGSRIVAAAYRSWSSSNAPLAFQWRLRGATLRMMTLAGALGRWRQNVRSNALAGAATGDALSLFQRRRVDLGVAQLRWRSRRCVPPFDPLSFPCGFLLRG